MLATIRELDCRSRIRRMSEKQDTVGEWIRRHRTDRRPKMSQQALADAAGLSRAYISLLERGGIHPDTGKKVEPDVETLDAIARVFAPATRFEKQFQEELRRIAAVEAGYIRSELSSGELLYERNIEEDEILSFYQGIPPQLKNKAKDILKAMSDAMDD